jgi:pimeloyl-ACP methyl ester carboxylesterase
VSYIEVGAGPPALFVHGIATNAYVWRELITATRRRAAMHRRRPAAWHCGLMTDLSEDRIFRSAAPRVRGCGA